MSFLQRLPLFGSPRKANKRVLFTALSAVVIIVGTFFAIQYAKGGRPTSQGIRETGLLVVNSFPTGSQVYINGELTTATDDTLNVDPGEYQVEIRKEGYTTWSKSLKVEQGLVTQTNAVLFPAVPSLSALTFTGVQNLSPAPDGQKLLYYTASASAEAKNGLYVVDLTDNPLSLQRGTRQVASDTNRINLETANYIWSPDSSEILITDGRVNLLIDINKLNDLNSIRDVSLQVARILSAWEEEMYLRERQILAKFPAEIIQLATESATNVYYSPDQEKLLYTAIQDLTLPDELVPPVPAANSQPQDRRLVSGGIYVYDRKEDRNFRIGTADQSENPIRKILLATDLFAPAQTLAASPAAFTRLQATESALQAEQFKVYHSPLYSGRIQWFPDSRHLIRTSTDHISIFQYDGTNEVTVYAGPFDPSFVYPWSNGSRLIITTSFNQLAGEDHNLYAIQLR